MQVNRFLFQNLFANDFDSFANVLVFLFCLQTHKIGNNFLMPLKIKLYNKQNFKQFWKM